jgi:hypothetical protein
MMRWEVFLMAAGLACGYAYQNALNQTPWFSLLLEQWIISPWLGIPMTKFHFRNAPFSSIQAIVTPVLGFFTLLYLSQRRNSNGDRKTAGSWIRFCLIVHNAALSLISLWLLLGLFELVPFQIQSWGLYDAICHPKAYTRELESIYWINYVIKFVEWVDTAFLVVMNKPLSMNSFLLDPDPPPC